MSDNDPGLAAALERAKSLQGADTSALRLQIAALLLREARFDDTFEICRGVLVDEPGNVDALELGGRAAQGLGLSERAERYRLAAELISTAAERAEREREAEPSNDLAPITPLQVLPGGGGTKTEGTVRLVDVKGMEAVKRRLKLSFLGPLQNPALRQFYGKSLRGGLLLWGPPGCGKTFLARAVAGELGASFMAVGLDDVLDMWTGQSERNVSHIFQRARQQAPCVLFFDEIDALGQKRTHLRGSSSRNVVVQLLTELDGVDGGNEGVFVLGATNHPWDVDTALRRPGRLDRMLLVLPPDLAAREAILRAQLASRPVGDVDLGALAQKTERFSGADLVQLVESAAELSLAASIDSGDMRPIGQAELLAALAEMRDSTSDWLAMARNYAEFAGEARGSYDDLLDYLRGRKAAR